MDGLIMSPGVGEKILRYVGDRLRFTFRQTPARLDRAKAFLRTNIGRAAGLRHDIIEGYSGHVALTETCWRDIPMQSVADEWAVELTLAEVGFFEAKAFLVDEQGRQYWPTGVNAGISVHPSAYRTGNTIYCAFTRMFGETKKAISTQNEALDLQLTQLDKQGYTVIPPSGKLRDLQRELPHIFDTLGCKILHLLPVNPTPTTYGRFGRFGSPYAGEDMTAIDPALVEFDKRSTGVDQFCELVSAVHLKGGRVFLDVVINHTGWGSTMQENHPKWFLREAGMFVSPGAWGTIWEDLVELNHGIPDSWGDLAEVFLTWCSRGVDGFRCDAGYKVPMPAWRYITARVREQFPEALFLLEGLGGAWEATENLLGEGGMQWAYSELFQNYSGLQVAGYLDHSLKQSERTGVLVHYSETHDNERLAKKGRSWALMRNQLSALVSTSGGYGFTCGVEWLATEKVNVHSSRGMAWGNPDNLLAELRQLNSLLANHPCFYDGAILKRLSPVGSSVYVLRRDSADGSDAVLVVINLDEKEPQRVSVPIKDYEQLGGPRIDVLGNARQPDIKVDSTQAEFTVPPAASYCFARTAAPAGIAGDAYTRARARAAWAVQALSQVLKPEEFGNADWRKLAETVDRNPIRFLGAIAYLNVANAASNLATALEAALAGGRYGSVITWQAQDQRRVSLVPPGHWLLIRDPHPFQVRLTGLHGRTLYLQSIVAGGESIASVPALEAKRASYDVRIILNRLIPGEPKIEGSIRFLSASPNFHDKLDGLALATAAKWDKRFADLNTPLALLTNGIGGMARMSADLGRIQSKYDCVLGANLNPAVPVDRHIFVKRIRAWVNANGFIKALDGKNLLEFQAGPPARWRFIANGGAGQALVMELTADMLHLENTTVLRFRYLDEPPPGAAALPLDKDVHLVIRVDIEDRNFHSETRHDGGAEFHFSSHCQPMKEQPGFQFAPAPDRALRVFASDGQYHPQPEWCDGIAHPVEAARGQIGSGDAYSPGWFELPIKRGQTVSLAASAEVENPSIRKIKAFEMGRSRFDNAVVNAADLQPDDHFGRQLARASQDFVVRRHSFKTVIAGYPWFLDWGRDSLICARGLLAAGMVDEVVQLLITFGCFEREGTLPNTIHGEDASNRDTSDAPMWYGLVCEEAAAIVGEKLYETKVDPTGRTLADVLVSLANGYRKGTSNGIRMDADSGLIWSPPHFTWMDTNYPAGTPRTGYPIEIQALWIRLLRQVSKISAGGSTNERWRELAALSEQSLHRFYWIEESGYMADLLSAPEGGSAADAIRDDALRSNYLFAITLGFLKGPKARRAVDAAARHLIVPGALRTLAPLPVKLPLPIYGPGGQLLNNPQEPYWSRYEGDEDTRRKPAYHNGTAWTWTFPSFCEALAMAWDFEPHALKAAHAYLGSMDKLLSTNCMGQAPEILDGDAPHQQRGCDAQAWGVTEALRVWKLLNAAQRQLEADLVTGTVPT